MQALLSLSFDHISSRNSTKIRKGLRQIEGLLAQICLSPSPPADPAVASTTITTTSQTATGRRPSSNANPPRHEHLDALATDPAFFEFFRLQESFEWNVATRLTETLERLLGFPANSQSEGVIVSTLTLLQGILLLHPPSRTLFSRAVHMNLLLDLLDPIRNDSETLCAALLVLVTALLDRPNNARLFETMDGLRTVCSLFHNKSPNVTREIRIKTMEFFYFYLMPETPPPPFNSTDKNEEDRDPLLTSRPTSLRAAQGVRLDKEPAAAPAVGTVNSNGSVRSWSSDGSEISITKTTEEKQKLLGEFLGDVNDLVQDLREGGTIFAV